MKKGLILTLAVLCLVSVMAFTAAASVGVDFIIASSGLVDYGGGGYKNDTMPADVRYMTTQNIGAGMRYHVRAGSSMDATTRCSGYAERYDSYDFTLSYFPAYQTTGNRSLWGIRINSSNYSTQVSGKFFP